MRHPRCFAVLKTVLYAAFGFPVAVATIVGALGPTYPGVKDWGQLQWDNWFPFVTHPWFIIAFLVLFVVFVTVLAYCGSGTSEPSPEISRIATALESLTQKLAGEPIGSKPVEPPREPISHDASGELVGQAGNISGTSNTRFTVTGTATGVVGLTGLYVGNIIVAAGLLETERRLDIAVRGYNGTGETICISEVSGKIRAGVGNKRDDIEIPLPKLKGLESVRPNEEFLISLVQKMPKNLVADFMSAWQEGRYGSLDLRGLLITARAVDNNAKTGRLPLWDGVNLRRVDDITSTRSTILSVGPAILSTNTFFDPVITPPDSENHEKT